MLFDAYLPNRNLLFLVSASAYAYQKQADAVSIGLLNDTRHLFPDQTRDFIEIAETMVSASIGRQLKVLTPLIDFSKQDVINAAERRGLTGTYSCHAGGPNKCGRCISCREFDLQSEEM